MSGFTPLIVLHAVTMSFRTFVEQRNTSQTRCSIASNAAILLRLHGNQTLNIFCLHVGCQLVEDAIKEEINQPELVPRSLPRSNPGGQTLCCVRPAMDY